MPQDVLTERLLKQLESMGIAASQDNVANILSDKTLRKQLVEIDPNYQRTSSLSDDLGAFLWHTAEGSTAGLLGYATDSKLEEKYGKPWDEKTTGERIGASLGEVAGLINPYGAFGLFGKATGKVVSSLSRGTGGILKGSAKSATANLVKESRKIGQGADGLGKIVRTALNKQSSETIIKGQAGRLSMGGKQKEAAVKTIQQQMEPAIIKALEQAGVKGQDNIFKLTRNISEAYATGIRGGQHLNNISSLVANAIGGVNKAGLRGGLNKYVGMAAQDMVMLGMYNSLAGVVHAKKTGTEFDASTTLKHALYLSLAFPALRRIPGGGQRTLKESKNFFGKWRGVDYSKMSEKQLNTTLGVMYGGEKAGTNVLKNMTFRVKGFADDINWGSTDNMSNLIGKLDKTQKIELANKIRDKAFSSGMKEWRNAWAMDMLKSSPRMAAGAAANNLDMFKDGLWAQIPPEEVLTHLLIGAFFTRGRGEWNHGVRDNTNLNDYYKLTNFMKLPLQSPDGTDLQSTLRWFEMDAIKTLAGVGMASDPTFKPLFDAIKPFDEAVETKLKNNKQNEPIKFNSESMPNDPDLMEVIALYNLAKYGKKGLDPDGFVEFDPGHLNKKQLQEFKDAVNSSVVGNTREGMQTLKQLGAQGLMHQAIKTMGNTYISHMNDFFLEVKRQLELDVKDGIGLDKETNFNLYDMIDGGVAGAQFIFPRIGDTSAKSGSTTQSFINFMGKLENHYKLGTGKKETTTPKFEVTNDNRDKVEKAINKAKSIVEEKAKLELFGEKYGGEYDLFGSDLLTTLSDAKSAMNTESWYYALKGKTQDKTGQGVLKLTPFEETLNITFDTYFGGNSKSIVKWETIRDNYLVRAGAKADDAYVNSEQGKNDLATLKQMHDLAKIGKTEVEDLTTQREIDLDTVKNTTKLIESSGLKSSVQGTFDLASQVAHFNDGKQLLRSQPIEKSLIVQRLSNLGMAVRENGMVIFLNKEGMKDQLRENYPDEYVEASENWQLIREFLGNGNGSFDYRNITVESSESNITPRDIKKMAQMLPEVWFRTTSEKLMKTQEGLNKFMTDNDSLQLSSDIENILKDYKKNPQNLDSSIEKLDEITRRLRITVQKDGSKEGLKVVDKLERKIKLFLKQNETELGKSDINRFFKLEGGEPTEDFKSLQQILNDINKPMAQLNQYLSTIMALGQSSITRPEAYIWEQQLKNELVKGINNGDFTKEMSLEKLVDKYRDTRNFRDWRNLIEGVTQFANAQHSIQGRSQWIKQQSENYYNGLKERYPRPSMTKLAKRYFLEPERAILKTESPMDEEFVSLVTKGFSKTDPTTHSDIMKYVRRRIESSQELTDIQKDNRIKEFEETGLIWIASNILNSRDVKTLTLEEGVLFEATENRKVSRRDRDIIDYIESNYGIDVFDVNSNVLVKNKTTGKTESITIEQLLNDPTRADEWNLASSQRRVDLIKVGNREDVSLQDVKPTALGRFVIAQVGAGKPFAISHDKLSDFSQVYKDWYNNTLSKWETAKLGASSEQVAKIELAQKNFRKAFEKLSDSDTVPELGNFETKFQGMYHDAQDPYRFLEFWGVADYTSKSHNGKFNDKFVKYSKQFEGGNNNPLSETIIDYVIQNHPKENVKAAFRELKTGINILGIKDEGAGDIFSLRNSLQRDIEREALVLGKSTKKWEEAARVEFLAELDNLESVMGQPGESISKKNAVTFIDEAQAIAYSIMNNQTFDATKMNGFKPSLSHVSADGMESVQQKTWYVYSPRMAAKMKDIGVNQISFGSALKTFGSLKGDKQLLELTESERGTGEKDTDTWMNALSAGRDLSGNIITVDPQNISLGFANHEGKSVTKGNTIGNLVEAKNIASLRAWQGMRRIISRGINEFGLLSDPIHARNEAAEELFKYTERDNDGFMSDNAELIINLIEIGMRPTNGTLSGNVNRMFMSKFMAGVRKPPDYDGISSYLTNDEIFDTKGNRIRLKAPLFSTKDDIRNFARFGEAAAPGDWGRMPYVNKQNIRLSVETVDGEVLIGYKPGDKADQPKFVVIDPRESRNGDLTKAELRQKKIDIEEARKILDGLDPEKFFTNGDLVNELASRDDIFVTTSLLAIPRKSADMVVNKVRHVLDAEYGNNWVLNDYELAVTHQRDFDGDHIYAYNNIPLGTMKSNIFQNAQIKDYSKFERDVPEINPYGFDNSTGVANTGEALRGERKSVGSYLNDINQRRMEIGSLVGMTQPLTWMHNIGLKIGDNRFEYIIDEKSNNLKQTIEVMGRTGSTNQNAFDFFSGKSRILTEGQPDIFRMMMYGVGAENIPTQIKGAKQRESKAHQTESVVEMDIAKAIARRLHRASILFNEPYEGGKQRQVTMQDLQFSHDKIQDLFNDPNGTVFADLLKQYSRDTTKNRAEIQELFKFFMGENNRAGVDFQSNESEAIKKIIKSVWKGEEGYEIQDKISFGRLKEKGTKKGEEAEELFKVNTGGQTLRELTGPGGLVQKAENGSDIESMSSRLSSKNDLDNTPEDIAAKTYKAALFAKMFGKSSDGATFDEVVLDIEKNINQMSGTDRAKMGVSIQLLDRKIRQANHQLLSMKDGSNIDYYRSVQDEVDALVIAKETIRKALINSSILDSNGNPIAREGFEKNVQPMVLKPGYYQNSYDKIQYIYRANTDVKNANMHQLAKEGILEYVGAVAPGKSFPINGNDHVVFRSPIDAIALSNKNAIYGIGWLKATADKNINYISEALGIDPLNLSSDILQLKRDLKDSFSYAIKAGLANPNRSIRGWETQSAYEQNRLGEFFEKYTKNLVADEAFELRQDLSLLLLSPDAMNNANIETGKAGYMPFFKTNNRIHKSVFNYLNKTGELQGSEVADRIEWVEKNYSHVVGVDREPSQDLFNNENLYSWQSHLSKHGSAQTFMRSLLKKTRPYGRHSPASSMTSLFNRLVGVRGKARFSTGELWKEGTREQALMFWMSPNAVSNYIAKSESTDKRIAQGSNCK